MPRRTLDRLAAMCWVILAGIVLACGGVGSTDPMGAHSPSSGSGRSVESSPAAATSSSSAADPDESRISAPNAVEVAHGYVRGFLEYPHDAVFDPGFLNMADYRITDTTAFVRGLVRAKNAFGAELTLEYRVHMRLNGDTLELLTLDIGDQVHYESPEYQAELRQEMSNLKDALAANAAKQKAEEERARAEAMEQKRKEEREHAEATFLSRYLGRLQRTFTSNDGSFTVEAVAVSVGNGTVDLVRMDDKKTITVKLVQLSGEDIAWVELEKDYIRAFGAKVKAKLLEADDAAAGDEKGVPSEEAK